MATTVATKDKAIVKLTVPLVRKTMTKMVKSGELATDRLTLQGLRQVVAKAEGKDLTGTVHTCGKCHRNCDGKLMFEGEACHGHHLPYSETRRGK